LFKFLGEGDAHDDQEGVQEVPRKDVADAHHLKCALQCGGKEVVGVYHSEDG
jgi:hypothetical protein